MNLNLNPLQNLAFRIATWSGCVIIFLMLSVQAEAEELLSWGCITTHKERAPSRTHSLISMKMKDGGFVICLGSSLGITAESEVGVEIEKREFRWAPLVSIAHIEDADSIANEWEKNAELGYIGFFLLREHPPDEAIANEVWLALRNRAIEMEAISRSGLIPEKISVICTRRSTGSRELVQEVVVTNVKAKEQSKWLSDLSGKPVYYYYTEADILDFGAACFTDMPTSYVDAPQKFIGVFCANLSNASEKYLVIVDGQTLLRCYNRWKNRP